ncbi:NRDE-2, necessary for RNA interference-domain-containing protein [Cantharellus anzutake]|uniref:NRDE-2, necessary for RNA interference-domain-containing protein n=1 Tax=Cantharellus anzutake TaxID=1750568 RepID=UPI0019082213|nr:NRDE-2, necessary for RNA interference-domain-containing protein [Cantharellus anzutake]KAF8327904.1 NRDE-2, necessary for RNA interference-domain-containing protein [Cantharellus anzutake]
MQAGKAAPSFSSFVAQSSDTPNESRSSTSRDHNDDHGKRHHSRRESKPYSSPSRGKEHSTKRRERKSLSGLHYERYSSSHRSSPSRHALDSPRILEEPRTPKSHILSATGTNFYDDRYGSTSTLFLEAQQYYLDGHRHVLGAPRNARLFRDSRSQKYELYIPHGVSASRAHTLRAFRLIAKTKARRLIPSSESLLPGEEDDFIPVQGKSLAGPDQVAPSGASDDSSDGESLNLPESDEDAPDARMTETARLERILAADKTNVNAWFNVIAHTASANPTPAGRADIWVTMLEKAIDSHPRNKHSTALRLRYLSIIRAAKGSEAEDVAWKEALDDIQDENLWLEYMNYRLQKSGIDSLAETLHMIRHRIRDTLTDERRKYYIQLRLFWRSVVALKEAGISPSSSDVIVFNPYPNPGYLERACAALQAQMELLYLRPAVLDSADFQIMLDGLEEFWDSEAPRIGEPHAGGWISWMKEEGLDAQHPPPKPGLEAVSNVTQHSLDGYQRWHDAETFLDEKRLLSARDGDGDDDPYSTVLFSDIRTLLFPPMSVSSFPKSSVSQLEEIFPLFLFLNFLGLHIPGLSDALLPLESETDIQGSDTPWSYHGPALNSSRIASLFSLPDQIGDTWSSQPSHSARQRWTSTDELVMGRERKMGSGWGPVKEWTLGLVGWLEGYGPQGKGNFRRIFQQVDSRLRSQAWANLWIAFEAAINVKESLKVSKSILSAFPTSLELWTTCAQLQCIRGKFDLARKVYQTHLETNETPQPIANWINTSDSRAKIGMWYAWAEMEWLDGQDSAVTRLLCRACGVSVPETDPDMRIPILRARQAYAHVLSSSSVLGETLVPLLNSYALFELLQKRDVPHVIQVYTPYLSDSPNDGGLSKRIREALVYGSARIIHHYTITLRNICPPIHLRKYIAQSVRQYPSNTLLLGVWLESERGEAVWGRVRGGISEAILDGAGDTKGGLKIVGVPRWLWSIWVEKWERGAWDVHRVRSMLHKRWRSQEFYLLAFGPLRPEFNPAGLEQVLNGMAERKVRLREGIPLKSSSVEIGSRTRKLSLASTTLMKGCLCKIGQMRMSKELKRLKPY